MKAKFINPFTDFGFKKIFAEEASKPLLIDFLNALLPQANNITDLRFKNTEQLGQTDYDRKAVYDIYCENQHGEKFIVELQKAKQNYFKERTIYYSTFPIREQAEKGDWNYDLKAVYCVGILDFTFDDYETEPEKSEVLHTIQLKNQKGKVFYEKLTYVYLEMPNFKKQESELNSRLDQWLYFIKNLEDFQTIPTIFKDKVFSQAFDKANLAKLNKEEYENYELNLKSYRDNKNILDYAFEEGKLEGRLEGKLEGRLEGKLEEKIEIAKNMIKMGIEVRVISELTRLNPSEIEKLK